MSLEVLLILDEAVSGFEQCQAVPHLKQSLFLQVFNVMSSLDNNGIRQTSFMITFNKVTVIRFPSIFLVTYSTLWYRTSLLYCVKQSLLCEAINNHYLKQSLFLQVFKCNVYTLLVISVSIGGCV